MDIAERTMGGFEGNIQGFFDHIFNVWNIIAQIIGFILILGLQLWWAPIVFVLASIPSFIISYRFGKKRYDVDKNMTKIDRKAWYISGILTSRDALEERYMYGYTDKMNDEYKAKYEMARIARKKVTKSLWCNTTVAGMLTFISGVVVVALLISSVITPNASGNTTSVGMFIALVGAILGLSQYVQDTIPDYIYSFRYKFEYLNELNEFLKFEENEDATCLPSTAKFCLESIEFKNVSFKYPGCEAYILKDFNVRLNAGKHYAIVGENGAGKTTLAKILTGLYDNYEGEILINGKELSLYTQSEIKAISAVLYQDFCRYPLDLYNNIAIGNINNIGDKAMVENAAVTIGLSNVVGNLANKYETYLTKVMADGVDVSGGEWQRIAFARLLVNPAPLKILDEPTSALDPISECRIYEQFGKIINSEQKDNQITIFISHRLGSTKLADSIIVISDGKAAEMGSFKELMLQDGMYAKMFKSQAEWYNVSENISESSGDKLDA